jgi:hypothetical protein
MVPTRLPKVIPTKQGIEPQKVSIGYGIKKIG